MLVAYLHYTLWAAAECKKNVKSQWPQWNPTHNNDYKAMLSPGYLRLRRRSAYYIFVSSAPPWWSSSPQKVSTNVHLLPPSSRLFFHSWLPTFLMPLSPCLRAHSQRIRLRFWPLSLEPPMFLALFLFWTQLFFSAIDILGLGSSR